MAREICVVAAVAKTTVPTVLVHGERKKIRAVFAALIEITAKA